MKLLLIILSLFATSLAFAGSVGHGGGKVLVCRENGQDNVYLADTYELMKSGELDSIKNSWPATVIEAVVSIMERTRPEKTLIHPFLPELVSLGWMIEHRHGTLDFSYEGKLPDLPDDFIAASDVPSNCHKEQLAIQDLGKNRVRVNLELLGRMTLLERGFFELHETWIAIRNQPGVDTTPIRSDVRSVGNILADPNYSAHNMILRILAGRPTINDFPAPNWGSYFVEKHCQNSILMPEFTDYLSVSKLLCPVAQRVDTYYTDKQDRDTALPTLLYLPQVLNCQIVSEELNLLALNPPAEFKLVRTNGTGKAYSENPKGNRQDSNYEIQFADGTKETDMNSQHLVTYRHVRQRGIDEIGDLDFRVSFQSQNTQKRIDLMVLAYLQMTGEFTGVIQISEDSQEQNVRFGSFGISCHAPDVKYGIDVLNSYK